MWPFKGVSEVHVAPPRPEYPINYPDGVAVETEESVYYIKNSKRYKFVSDRAVATWGLVPVQGSEASVKHIEYGGILGFRDGTLIEDISNGKLYLISNSRKRHIVGPDTLNDLGWSRNQAVQAGHSEVEIHPSGDDLD